MIYLEIGDQVWELENMLKYFQDKIFAEERRVSLKDKKQPSTRNVISYPAENI